MDTVRNVDLVTTRVPSNIDSDLAITRALPQSVAPINDVAIYIQSPSTEIFDASTLKWQLYEDPCSKYKALTLAYIPWDRLHHFVEGEKQRKEAPTKFRVQWKKTRSLGSLKRPTPDSFLTQIGYWCCFGPDDYRGEVPKSHPKRRATKGKHFVGCQCHFVVSQLYQFPNVARINYIQYQHIDGSDNICHGELYDGPINKLRFAPWLSSQMKEWVCNLLQRGFTPQQVFSQHIQRVERCNMDGTLSSSRDLFLTMRDILNITCMMENVSLHTHQDDAISVNNWVVDNPHQVFYYQVMNERKDEAFILGIQTQWQLQMFSKYGHDGLLAMDATFGTNKYKFYLYTILVFDAFRNGVPIAWTITSSASCVNITKWLSALRNRVLNINKGWEPNAFMVDDAEADIQALRKVFGIGMPILLCIWHVRRAWLKNLVKKVANASIRADMFKHLGLIMNRQSSLCKSLQDKEGEAHKLLVEFMEKYESEVLFIDYFRREWLPRIGMWIRSCRVMKIANQDTNGSIESYHGVLKSKFLGGKRSIHGRRVDWLLKMLVGSCHSYFWYQEMLKDSGFKKNFKVMDVAKNSLARAMEIPDEFVRFHGDNYKHAKVLSLTKQLYFHTVFNADTQWATCTCDWAERGNLCKHQVKVMMLIGIDVRTIVDKGVDMYNKSLDDETKAMQCNFEPFDNLDSVNPIEHVDFPPNKDTGGKDYVALIQQNVLQSLQIAGDDAFLLEHVFRRSTQMLTSTQEMKASESRMSLHPCGEFQCIEDAFGTSLKRAKPFIEKGGRKRNKPCKEHGHEVTSFPTCPKTKRSTMQSQLDKHARVDKDNM